MIDIRSFTLSLPSFIERSYFISPGVVSVIFKVIWSIFTFLVVTFLIQYGLAATGIKENEMGKKQKSLWHFHQDYSKIQSVSNGRWGGMISNLPSIRVILGFLFWIFIYAFELLFSLSIDNAYITNYNGTACVGRVNNFTTMKTTMWYSGVTVSGVQPPQNSTLLRQLLNQKQVGNIVLLGDGIFAISPTDALYKKNQEINVARTGFNCDYTVNLEKFAHGEIYYPPSPGSNISTPNFPNVTSSDLGILAHGYVNLNMVVRERTVIVPGTTDDYMFLILVSNPTTANAPDINQLTYNSSVILQECTTFYEYGVVTIAEDGYLNETSIGESYRKIDNDTVDREFHNSYMDSRLIIDTYLLSLYDYPNELLDIHYNKTYPETMKIANSILAAHLVNGLDTSVDLCTFNQEQVPVYYSVLGTKMSFGYILLGGAFAIVVLLILSAIAFAMFSQEERRGWLLYSNDWRFAGYIYTGSNIDQRTFNDHAKNIYIKHCDSKDEFQENGSDEFYSETLLKKNNKNSV